jgi:hypothetical protein
MKIADLLTIYYLKQANKKIPFCGKVERKSAI